MSSPYLRLSRIEADLDVVDRSSRHTEPTTAADERHRPDARSDEAAATTLDAALRELEYEYFFGKLARRIGRAGKALLKKGLAAAAPATPILSVARAVTDLGRGHLRRGLVGLARGAARAGLAASAPWALPAVEALGAPRRTRDRDPAGPAAVAAPADAVEGPDELPADGASDAIVEPDELPADVDAIAERAYELLAERLGPEIATPAGAARVAADALADAVRELRRPCTCQRRGRRR
ncbi:MAG: hypothetical protein IPH44_35100 [Myxococcales bacterium]|nr:hypothetical protein [Myxococcales bacterium]MBK7194662.1 hypothetical protein [Myxococcales bacterium]MBP6842234.1 hypothetical protein [Kofleriaceae bacterium]